MGGDLPSIPEAISDLSLFRFLARRAVEGTLSGVHRSGLFGSSIEFAEHKPYSAGDDLKHVDWKVFGRADKYYVKRFEDETNLRAYIVLDVSASMNFGTVGYTKANYAVVLAATLAYLFIQQQDLVGLLRFGNQTPTYVPPRGRMPHFQVLSEMLQSTQAEGETKVVEAMAFLRERIHRRAVVVVLSDFLLSPEKVSSMFKLFSGQEYDIFWGQIIDPAELEFPYRDWTTFKGLEGEPNLELNAGEMARAYRTEIHRWIELLRDSALERNTRHRLIRTDEQINQVLASVLS